MSQENVWFQTASFVPKLSLFPLQQTIWKWIWRNTKSCVQWDDADFLVSMCLFPQLMNKNEILLWLPNHIRSSATNSGQKYTFKWLVLSVSCMLLGNWLAENPRAPWFQREMQPGYIEVDSLLKYSTPYFRLLHLTASLFSPLAQVEAVLFQQRNSSPWSHCREIE